MEAKGPVWPPPGRGTGVNMCPGGPGRPLIFDLEELFGITKWLAHTQLPLRAAYTTGPQLNTQESGARWRPHPAAAWSPGQLPHLSSRSHGQ